MKLAKLESADCSILYNAVGNATQTCREGRKTCKEGGCRVVQVCQRIDCQKGIFVCVGLRALRALEGERGFRNGAFSVNTIFVDEH